MTNNTNTTDIDTLIKTMVDLSYDKYGSYSHAAGVLQSMTAYLLAGNNYVEQHNYTIRNIKNIIAELEMTHG